MSDDPTVFVVDDDQAAAASMVAVLTSVGHSVEAYNSAEDFLAAYDGKRDGCLVLDVRLKGMSGPKLQQSLAAKGLAVPVVMISGHMDLESANSAAEYGAVACLEKPFTGDDLCEAVRAALGQS